MTSSSVVPPNNGAINNPPPPSNTASSSNSLPSSPLNQVTTSCNSNTTQASNNSSSSVNTTIPPSLSNTVTPTMLAAAYSTLSPSSRAALNKLIQSIDNPDPASGNTSTTPTTTPPSSPSSTPVIYPLVFRVENEKADELCNVYDIHPAIPELAANLCHVPLTLLTSEATRRLFTEDSAIKKKQIIHRVTKAKAWIIDISEFPKESEMSIGDWHSAWRRLLSLMTKIADKTISRRWSDHYDYLASQEDFAKDFPAILNFDIEQRTSYFCSPHSFNEDQYYKRFERLRINAIKDDIIRERESLRADRMQYPSRSNRHLPYARDRPSTPYSPSDNTKSFRPPRNDLPPICFICKRDHKFSKCNETTTKEGQQTFAKRIEKQIVKRDGNAPVCFYFNASNRRCERSHSDLHVCSLCGSSDHGACSRKCL